MDIKNRVIAITGSSKGLGKALAAAFLRHKAKVIINAPKKSALKEVTHKLGAEYFVADVAKRQEMFALARFAQKKFGRIDVWVNNAGIWLPWCDIAEIDPDKLHQVMEVNLFGTIYGSQAALTIMRKQKNGMIINILSTSALVGRSQSAGYASTKWAARGFTESLRLALTEEKIKVMAIYPGAMKTDIFGDYLVKDYKHFMEPKFVADAILNNLGKKNPRQELIIDTNLSK